MKMLKYAAVLLLFATMSHAQETAKKEDAPRAIDFHKTVVGADGKAFTLPPKSGGSVGDKLTLDTVVVSSLNHPAREEGVEVTRQRGRLTVATYAEKPVVLTDTDIAFIVKCIWEDPEWTPFVRYQAVHMLDPAEK